VSAPVPVVERLHPGDEQRLRAVRLRALAEDPDAFYRTLADDEPQPPQFWTRWLTAPGQVVLVARLGDRDVGLAALVPDRRAPDERAVVAFWVDPAVRGRGVARALLVELVSRAELDGVPAVSLEVADSNAAAITLYADLGFEPTGETGAFPPPRGHVTEHRRRLVLDRGAAPPPPDVSPPPPPPPRV